MEMTETTITQPNNAGTGEGTQPNPASTFSPEQIETAISAGFEKMAAATKPQEREPTQAELDSAAKVWRPDKKYVQELRRVMSANDENPVSDEEMLAPFNSLRDSLMAQSQTHAENLVRAALEHINKEYSPLRTELANNARQKTDDAFYKQFPSLAEHKEIVQAVAAKFASEKREVKSPAEAFTLLAKNVETVIKRLKPDFALEEVTTPVNSGGAPRTPALSTGGQGGAGANGGQQTQKSGASSIWSK